MKYYNKLQRLIGRRGTKKEIEKLLSETTTSRPLKLCNFAEPTPDQDYGFEVFLGMDGKHYLDYDIYLLKTNQRVNSKRVWCITEINPSY